MSRFDFNPRTGMMEPRKNEQIYFAGSQGGGLRVDDHKHNIKYIIERDGTVTRLSGSGRDGDAFVAVYDMRDARMISDRVVRMFGRSHRFSDFHMFLMGHSMRENVVLNFDEYVEEGWGALVRRDLTDEVRDEDKKVFTSKYDFQKFINDEIRALKDGVDEYRASPCIYQPKSSTFFIDLFDIGGALSQTEVKKLDLSNIRMEGTECDFSNMFQRLYVKEIILPNMKDCKIKSCESMFMGCTDLVNVAGLDKMDVSGVDNFAYMFEGCRHMNLTPVESWDVSSGTNFTSMFDGACDESNPMDSLDLSGWKISTKESDWVSMEKMFKGCSVRRLNLTGWDGSRIFSMEGMFSFCQFLESVEGIGGMKPEMVNSLEGMFNRSPSLKSMDLSGWADSVKKVKSIEKMFNRCVSLAEVNMDNWDLKSLVRAKDVFRECPVESTVDLTSWTVPPFLDNCSRITGKTPRYKQDDGDNKLKLI